MHLAFCGQMGGFGDGHAIVSECLSEKQRGKQLYEARNIFVKQLVI